MAGAKTSNARLWVLVAFLSAASVLSYVDRQILALMIGPVKRDLGISDTQVGLLIGLAFSLFYSAMMLPMAWLADKYSRRTVIGVGMFSWSFMTALSGLARTYEQLFVARMGVGIGEAALNPAAYSMIADAAPAERQPFFVGIFTAAPFVGIGLASILGGALIGFLESAPPISAPIVGELRSWQWTFLLLGIPGMVLSLLAFRLSEPERKVSKEPEVGGVIRPVVRFIRAHPLFVSLHFGGLLLLAVQAFTSFAWTAEFFIREHGMSRAEVGFAYGLIAMIGGLSGSTFAGYLAGALLKRGVADATMRLVAIAAVLMAPLAIALPLAPNAGVALAVLAPLTFLMAWPAGLGVAALQSVTPGEARGRVLAVYLLLINFLPVSIGPLMVGLVNDLVFAGAAIGQTFLLLAAIIYPAGALLAFLSLKPFRSALARGAAS